MYCATALFKLWTFIRQCHTNEGKEGKVIAERHTGALPGAFAHSAAKSAIDGAIVFVLSELQLRSVCAKVTEHTASPFKNKHTYYIIHQKTNKSK
jgi:hypothetical protein